MEIAELNVHTWEISFSPISINPDVIDETNLMLTATTRFLKNDDYIVSNYSDDLLRNAIDDLLASTDNAKWGIWGAVYGLLENQGLGGVSWRGLRDRFLSLEGGFRNGDPWESILDKITDICLCRRAWTGRLIHMLLSEDEFAAEPLFEPSIDTSPLYQTYQAYFRYTLLAIPAPEHVVEFQIEHQINGDLALARVVYRTATSDERAEVAIHIK